SLRALFSDSLLESVFNRYRNGCSRVAGICNLEENFNAKHNHHYHLVVKGIKRFSLSDANLNSGNNSRPSALFMETFYFLWGRMKSNAVYEVIESRETAAEHVLEDPAIRLSSANAQKDCPTDLRRTTIIKEENEKVLSFIANALERSAQEIADLYKIRW
ncbi:MAG: hypothetical protein ACPG5T_00780, partial [Endozoicomonas sp.]